jgi:hypothetical protein
MPARAANGIANGSKNDAHVDVAVNTFVLPFSEHGDSGIADAYLLLDQRARSDNGRTVV